MEETEFCQFSLCAQQITVTISKGFTGNTFKNFTVLIKRLGTKRKSP